MAKLEVLVLVDLVEGILLLLMGVVAVVEWDYSDKDQTEQHARPIMLVVEVVLLVVLVVQVPQLEEQEEHMAAAVEEVAIRVVALEVKVA